MKVFGTLAVSLALFSHATRARADGVDIGHSLAECTADPPLDRDQDGIDDSCEYELASSLAPQLVFAEGEDSADRETYWSAKPLIDSDGNVISVRIFYALGYFLDTGESVVGTGFLGHYGDSEFIALDVSELEGRWVVGRAFLSAHFGAGNDASDWYPASSLEWDGEPFGAPKVYVSLFKHANYPDGGTCKRHPKTFDRCPREGCDVREERLPGIMGMMQPSISTTDPFCAPLGVTERVSVRSERNLGRPFHQLVDEPTALDDFPGEEWFQKRDVVFCGWQTDDGFDRDTVWWAGGCVPPANSYSRELDFLEMLDARETPIPDNGSSGAGKVVSCEAFVACICGNTEPSEADDETCTGIREVVASYREDFGQEAADRHCTTLLEAQPAAASACGLSIGGSSKDVPECDALILCSCASLTPSDTDSADCQMTRAGVAQYQSLTPEAAANACRNLQALTLCIFSRSLDDCLGVPNGDDIEYFCEGGCEPVERDGAPCGAELKCLPASDSGRCIVDTGTAGFGDACAVPRDCAGAATCDARVCSPFCRTDDDCPAAQPSCESFRFSAGNGDQIGLCKGVDESGGTGAAGGGGNVPMLCHELEHIASRPPGIIDNSAPPEPMGGVIQGGVYVATAETIYEDGAYCGEAFDGVRDSHTYQYRPMDESSGIIDGVDDLGIVYSLRYRTSDTSMTTALVCPTEGSETQQPYTATTDTILLFDDQVSCGTQVTTLTRQ